MTQKICNNQKLHFTNVKMECLKLSLDLARDLGFFHANSWEKKSNTERQKILEDILITANDYYKFVTDVKIEE